MVKVLCRGGPAFWIKEPFTPEEQAYEDAIKRGERPAAPEGYDEDWMLMDNEVWPLTEAEEADFWAGFGEIKHIGFYGAAPHRPKGVK
jgi:hypothetical protein